MEETLERTAIFLQNHFFNVTSLVVSVVALVLAVLAFRVAKQALLHTRETDLATRKLQAHEKCAQAKRSYMAMKMNCQNLRSQWEAFHNNHYSKLGTQVFIQRDLHHIDEVEIEAGALLRTLTLNPSEINELDTAGLDTYIVQSEQTVSSIEQLSSRLSPPKQLLS